jgi:hypothetical protein
LPLNTPTNKLPIDRPKCCGKSMFSRGGRADSGKRRWRCGECGRSTTASTTAELDNRDLDGYNKYQVAENNARVRRRVKSGHRRFVVTAAQNNTRLHPGWQALLNYCAVTDAELLVVPIHYKNISLFTAAQVYQKSWARELDPYLVDDHIYLGGGVDVAAEIKIAATAARPLTGMQAMGSHRWQVIGHSKHLMEPVATPQDMKPKRLYTTGAVTVRNYSKTKQGALAEFHHSTGAIVVEVSGRDTAFIRQLGISGSSLFDVSGGELREYGPDWVKDHDRVPAVTTGDEHVKFHDKGVRRGTYGPQGLVTKLNPKALFRHDLLDGYAGSHHHEKDPLIQFRKYHSGDDCYRTELEEVVRFLDETTPEGVTNYIVDSNHHDHLMQWLNRTSPNKDHRNAMLIAEMQLAVRQATLDGRDFTALQLYCEDKVKAPTVWLERDKPFLIQGVDYSQHGDIGINGSRGSASALSKTTYKTVIGHSHTARIVDGCYQVGHSAGKLEYAKGLGTWTHTHCIQYPNGKRTLVDIVRGRWHG